MLLQILLITLSVVVGIVVGPYIIAYPAIAASAIVALIATIFLYRRKKGMAE